MSRRWFVSSVGVGAAALADVVEGARRRVAPSVKLRTTFVDGRVEETERIRGPRLSLVGPGDVLGFDASMVVREEPPAGSTNADESCLASVDFADASLPWLLSLAPDPARPTPWLILLVLRADEGALRAGDPLPVVTVPGAALPDPADAWAWAHVEARVADAAPGPEADVEADVRTGSQAVVSRLLCPRRLAPDTDWVACVVPLTKAGRAAGLGQDGDAPDAAAPAWRARQSEPVDLPVYHSWTFRTGPAGTFEALARLVQPVKASELPGFGAREIDVRRPWPHADLLEGAPDDVRVSVQGALRVPGTEVPDEVWSDQATQERFDAVLRERLDGPAEVRGTDEARRKRSRRVAPPLYGSHHTGAERVPGDGWMAAMNRQVRHRVAAALGARYVQLEDEFLMARAWEQIGVINEANRLLRVSEVADEAATKAQAKHLSTMDAVALTVHADVMGRQVQVADAGSLAEVVEASGVPDGAGSVAFTRIARRGGALARRSARAAAAAGGAMPSSGHVVADGMAGTPVLHEATAWLTAQADAAADTVATDAAAVSGAQTLTALLDGQAPLFAERSTAVGEAPAAMLSALRADTQQASSAAVTTLAAPMRLRALRRDVNAEPLTGGIVAIQPELAMDVGEVAAAVRERIRALPQQLDRVKDAILAVDVAQRFENQPRPLRPIMAHPQFGMPIAAEIIARWPEWAVPGVAGFPANASTLLETNSPWVEALLVGLNHEFNRELLWREFPTDQRGTPFARFWPPESVEPDVDEIARWPDESALGEHDRRRGEDRVVLLLRAEVLRRYPGALVLAAKSVRGRLPDDGTGEWMHPSFVLPVDDQTALYGFELSEARARDEKWLFVLREPMRATRFGFDLRVQRPRHSIPGVQEGWKKCSRCHGLNLGEGTCFDGAPHDLSASGHYAVPLEVVPAGAQPDWRFCSRCQGLVFSLTASVCVGGQPHDLSSIGAYSVPLDPAVPGMEDGWRWCAACSRLAFAGDGPGACVAAGVHQHADSGAYRLPLAEAAAVPVSTWADLTWDDVPLERGFLVPRRVGALPPTPAHLAGADPGAWGADAADVARIAFQRPFQMAFSPGRLLGAPT